MLAWSTYQFGIQMPSTLLASPAFNAVENSMLAWEVGFHFEIWDFPSNLLGVSRGLFFPALHFCLLKCWFTLTNKCLLLAWCYTIENVHLIISVHFLAFYLGYGRDIRANSCEALTQFLAQSGINKAGSDYISIRQMRAGSPRNINSLVQRHHWPCIQWNFRNIPRYSCSFICGPLACHDTVTPNLNIYHQSS